MKRILLLVGLALFLLAGCGGDDDDHSVEQGALSSTAPSPGTQDTVSPGLGTEVPANQDPGTQDPANPDPQDPVVDPNAPKLTIVPEELVLTPPENIQLKAFVTYPDGTKIEVTHDPNMIWNSSAPDIAGFNFSTDKGRLFANDLGTADITGKIDGMTEKLTVTVRLEEPTPPEFPKKDASMPDPPDMPAFPER